VGEEVGEVAEQQSVSWKMNGLMIAGGFGVSLFRSDLIMRIDGCEFGSSSGGPNHLVIEGPSSDGSRVAASLDDVNSPSSSIRSVPKDEESYPSSFLGSGCTSRTFFMASWPRSVYFSRDDC
jgi:hypothetical protein